MCPAAISTTSSSIWSSRSMSAFPSLSSLPAASPPAFALASTLSSGGSSSSSRSASSSEMPGSSSNSTTGRCSKVMKERTKGLEQWLQKSPCGMGEGAEWSEK